MARKKQKLCRICKKRPVWRGGDVKDPGPHCKRCYHKHVWSQGPGPSAGRKRSALPPEPDYYHCPMCGIEADVCGGGVCLGCGFDFSNALYEWFA